MVSLRRGSHRQIEVVCESGASAKCKARWRVQERLANETRARNQGRIICIYCSRETKNVGRSNPNTRYRTLDDAFFRDIDTEAKAYLLGWIASDGALSPNSLSIYVHHKDQVTLASLRDLVCDQLPIKPKRNTPLVGFTINSRELVADVCRWLSVEPRKKSGIVAFPQLSTPALGWAFVRGVFDGDGSISTVEAANRRAKEKGWPSPRCSIANNSVALLDAIRRFTNIPVHQSLDSLQWHGANALDFLGKIYSGANIFLQRKRDLYLDWCTWAPATNWGNGSHPLFKWNRVLQNAIAPGKEFASDSGFDLTLLERSKVHGNVEFYRTGVRIQPAFGWYFDLVPRSSISKTGYMLANSVGVIDRAYVGEILVPLVKVDATAPDLPLPSRLVQIIPRQIVNVEFVEVDELESTARGAGGFGSTNR